MAWAGFTIRDIRAGLAGRLAGWVWLGLAVLAGPGSVAGLGSEVSKSYENDEKH